MLRPIKLLSELHTVADNLAELSEKILEVFCLYNNEVPGPTAAKKRLCWKITWEFRYH